MVLEMKNIKKSFTKVVEGKSVELEVLKDISVSVDKGEIISIIGPSGSGINYRKAMLLFNAGIVFLINSILSISRI